MKTRTSSTLSNPPESQVTLEQALGTLRGIRRRYEIERTAHPDARSNVHLALGDSDMLWITATIEALEKSIAAGAIEAGHLDWQRECARRLRDILSRPAQGMKRRERRHPKRLSVSNKRDQ